ncbi:hypothetical protein GPL21_39185 [Bradyrhizobium pachyrhizi]|uniref:Helix-turn-helix domain-containing protein n=1 Tax=Bradyrhizobium pachyrhizi TaxID=280333 RepID=A0A844T3T5_9BRAD|nr:hypothetical protein [Bradyrhizobium pachyrhizi]MVT71069.1 hypothetical protein [Bradyrhizobium pachyrhizi]
MAQSSANILDGFVEEVRFAADNGISTRTLFRYRNSQDGLPFAEFGGRIYIPLNEAKAWLNNRIKRPNQRRRGA